MLTCSQTHETMFCWNAFTKLQWSSVCATNNLYQTRTFYWYCTVNIYFFFSFCSSPTLTEVQRTPTPCDHDWDACSNYLAISDSQIRLICRREHPNTCTIICVLPSKQRSKRFVLRYTKNVIALMKSLKITYRNLLHACECVLFVLFNRWRIIYFFF